MAKHLNRKDLIDHPDFSNREDRKKNRLRLKAELETVLTTRSTEEWVEELNQIGVPAGPVLSIPEVLDHPQITERGLIANLDNIPDVKGNIEILKTAAIFNGRHLDVENNPPALGADNERVYSNIGLTKEEINRCENDPKASLVLISSKTIEELPPRKKDTKYTPISLRQEKPYAILWLIKRYPNELSSSQIAKLTSSTKNTVEAIRNGTYREAVLESKSPMDIGLCTYEELEKSLNRSRKKTETTTI